MTRGGRLEQPIARDRAVARGLLDREDLLQRLDRAVSKRVTVISAPAGSGKTSLLRTWSDHAREDRRIGFVSATHDQDAQRFWLAVLDAIRRSPTTTGSRSRSAASGFDGDAMVDTIVSELADQAEVVMIIDDLHELSSADAFMQLERLLAILPSSAHVVLSSRRDPPIKLHQLRLADEVAEIRGGNLRFSERETRELLAASGIGLTDAGEAALYQRTEGWAAGLRLAIISLSGHPDPERFVDDFSGTDRAIGEYLMAEMLEGQPNEVQSMLLRTSLVDRLNGELADLLAGRSGSEQMLLELEDANAFVVSLDAQRTWFRYHQLLADFLRLELRRRWADEVPDLHRRAARWFADHGEVVDTVRHMLAAGDWPEAARFLADHLFGLTLDGQEGAVAVLLLSFPDGASTDDPDLALAHAAVELAQGRLEEAAAQLTLAESHIQSTPPARRERLGVAIASSRLALARRIGRFTEVMGQVNLLDASIADGSSERIAMGSELRAVALMDLGIVETWSGRFEDAERHVTEGAALAQAIGRPYIEVACRAYQAFPSMNVSLREARERGRHAFALAEEYGLSDREVLAPAFGAVACIALWMGEFEEGERWLRRGWDVVRVEVDPAAMVLLHMVTGMLHAGRGEHRSALESLTAAVQAQSLLSGVHILATVIAEWLVATQARLEMWDAARATLDGLSTEQTRMNGAVLARAVISLAEGDPATALAVLGDIQDFMPPPGFPAYGLVEAHVIAGLAHLGLGDRGAAAAAAEAALAAAEPDRLIFPFAMNDAAALLAALPGYETAHRAFLADIVDVLQGAPLPDSERDGLWRSEELSPSELRALRYLPTNLTRPEIAQESSTSRSTRSTRTSATSMRSSVCVIALPPCNAHDSCGSSQPGSRG